MQMHIEMKGRSAYASLYVPCQSRTDDVFFMVNTIYFVLFSVVEDG